MTKGEQIVALAMGKGNREGYPKLTEEHPFFGKLNAFMDGKYHWLGTATDLLNEMNDTATPPNTVTKLLKKFEYNVFKCYGIEVFFRRTNRRRIIEIYNYRHPQNKA